MLKKTASLLVSVAVMVLVTSAAAIGSGSESYPKPVGPLSGPSPSSNDWLKKGPVVFHLAGVAPWARSCANIWTPSISEVRLVESAISREHPDFLRGRHRLYAGACIRHHRVLRGRLTMARLYDSRTGALLPAGLVEVVSLDQMLHPIGPMWGAVGGTCWIRTGVSRPTEANLRCILG